MLCKPQNRPKFSVKYRYSPSALSLILLLFYFQGKNMWKLPIYLDFVKIKVDLFLIPKRLKTRIDLTQPSWPSLKSSPLIRIKNELVLFLKMGQTRPLSLFISVLFSTQWQYCTKFDCEKRRLCAWDSNTGRQDGRRRRIDWAMVAPLC